MTQVLEDALARLEAPEAIHKERIEALAQLIEDRTQASFNMTIAILKRDCGTVACLAGHAALMALDEGLISNETLFDYDSRGADWRRVRPVANSYLGLSNEITEKLFEPKMKGYGYDITPQQAAGALRRVASGEVKPDEVWDFLKT